MLMLEVVCFNFNPYYPIFLEISLFDLYVLGDDVLICKGSFMQTKHLCVLIGQGWCTVKPV